MKSEKKKKNCIKKVTWGIVSGLDPLSVTKKNPFWFRHPEPSVDLLCCLCWVYIFSAWCLGWDFKFNCIHSCALFFIFSNSVMKHPKIIVQDGQNLLTLQR